MQARVLCNALYETMFAKVCMDNVLCIYMDYFLLLKRSIMDYNNLDEHGKYK